MLSYWFSKTEVSDSAELHQSALRAGLYAMMELVKNVDGSEVLTHLTQATRLSGLCTGVLYKKALSCIDAASIQYEMSQAELGA